MEKCAWFEDHETEEETSLAFICVIFSWEIFVLKGEISLQSF